MEISPYYKLKCIFVGESSVGKTSMVHLLHHEYRDLHVEPTIGLAFTAKDIQLEEYPLSNPSNLPYYYQKIKNDRGIVNNNQLITLYIWDVAGNPRFYNIIASYMRDVDICFLSFDISRRETWEALPKWRDEVLKHAKFEKIPIFVIIANKSDMKNKTVSLNEIKRKAEEWKCKFYSVTTVETNSAASIRNFIYNSVKEYHDLILLEHHEGNLIPEHVKVSFFQKNSQYVDLESEESKYNLCCYQ